MAEEIRARGQRRDRWVSWIVVAVFIVALILGWVVKSQAENRTVFYQGGGIEVNYPEGWLARQVEDPVLIQVEDRWAGTSLSLQRRALPTGVEQPFSEVAVRMALERSQWSSYRELDRDVATAQEPIWIGGRQAAMRVEFAYVEPKPQAFQSTMPVVMHGDDYFFQEGDSAYIVTLIAAEANYAQARGYLEAFVATLRVK